MRTQELEFSIGTALGDIRIQIEKRINVPAVARQVDDLTARDRIADRLIFGIDQWRFRRDLNAFGSRRYPQHGIGCDRVASLYFDARNLRGPHAWRRD